MEETDVLETLLELASDAGLRVRVAGREPVSAGGPSVSSGVCRVKGELFVILAAADPPAAQIRMLASALETHAGPLLEERHLPPAVRALFTA